MSEREKFEKWFSGHILKHSENVKNVAWEAWQAALSTRKPYALGIVNTDGKAEDCGGDRDAMEKMVHYLEYHYPENAPYRIVELFYEDQ